MSSFRFARAAHRSSTPIYVVNIGPTRGDELASMKIESKCSEVLRRLTFDA